MLLMSLRLFTFQEAIFGLFLILILVGAMILYFCKREQMLLGAFLWSLLGGGYSFCMVYMTKGYDGIPFVLISWLFIGLIGFFLLLNVIKYWQTKLNIRE